MFANGRKACFCNLRNLLFTLTELIGAYLNSAVLLIFEVKFNHKDKLYIKYSQYT